MENIGAFIMERLNTEIGLLALAVMLLAIGQIRVFLSIENLEKRIKEIEENQ